LKENQEIFKVKESVKEILMNSKNFTRHPGLKKLVSFYQLYLSNDWKKEKNISALSSYLSEN
jgi:hypothetical protein